MALLPRDFFLPALMLLLPGRTSRASQLFSPGPLVPSLSMLTVCVRVRMDGERTCSAGYPTRGLTRDIWNSSPLHPEPLSCHVQGQAFPSGHTFSHTLLVSTGCTVSGFLPTLFSSLQDVEESLVCFSVWLTLVTVL